MRNWRRNCRAAGWIRIRRRTSDTFCAVCEPEDGWVTMLSKTLWPTEVIRRLRPAVERFDVYLARPH